MSTQMTWALTTTQQSLLPAQTRRKKRNSLQQGGKQRLSHYILFLYLCLTMATNKYFLYIFFDNMNKCLHDSCLPFRNDTAMNEHLDPNSYSWCLMRYAVIKHMRHSLIQFLPHIGIELPGQYYILGTSF